MSQAIGANAYFAWDTESTYGAAPGSPAMKLLKAAAYGETLGAEFQELMSNAINSNRSVEMVRGGNFSCKGAVPFELPILGIASLVKKALGSSTTSGTGTYTHTIKRGATLGSMTIEKGFTDLAQYLLFTGCMVNGMSLSVRPGSLVTGSLDVIAQDVAISASPLDAVLDTVTHTPFAAHECTFTEAGTTVKLLGADIQITNNLDSAFVCGSRYVDHINPNKGEMTGDLTLMFDSVTHFNKWLAETASYCAIAFTSGSYSHTITVPNLRYIGDAVPKIATPQGVVVPLKFRGIYDSTEASDVKWVAVTTEATI
jgi:hypothetical protein